jgi:glycosyltransferase involved in cell wall biosynthesis
MRHPLKVLHVIPSVGVVRGGPSQAVLEMVQALRQMGIDAEIACTNDNGAELLDVPLHCRSEFAGVPVWFFPRFSPPVGAIREFAFSRSLTTWLWQHMADYDVVHIHAIFSYASTVAMAIARRQHIPYIVRPLGQLCTWSLQQRARKKQWYLRLIERANLDHSQALHLTSDQEYQEVAQLHLRPRSVIVPHGLVLPPVVPQASDRLRQHLGLPGDEPIVVFLSRLHPKKGLDVLIPALGQLSGGAACPEDNRRFTFVLAGTGDADYEAEVTQLLQRHGLSARTHRVGFVQGAAKDLLLQGADLFALTSHSENFGIAVLEALAAGLPVVVTPGVALAPLVVAQRLGYGPELTVEAVAQAVEQALGDRARLRDMGDRARQIVATQYSWKRVAEQLVTLYTDVAAQPVCRKATLPLVPKL